MSTKIFTKEEIIHNAISEFNGRDETRADIALANKREQVDGRGTQAVSDVETAHEGNRPEEKSEVEGRDRSSGQENSRSKRTEEIKIAVGDVFVSNTDEKTYRIIERTNDTTSVEVTSGNRQ